MHGAKHAGIGLRHACLMGTAYDMYTVRQEIFAANNSRGFRGSKGSAKLFIREH